MAKEIRRTAKFKKDYKREKKTHPDLDELLHPVLMSLMNGQSLPQKYKDHALIGDWKDHRDCHIKPDLLLLYMLEGDSIILTRMGSHGELF